MAGLGQSTGSGSRGFSVVDGSHGEGGGQLVRLAVALAAVTGTAIRMHSVRSGRRPPGLAAQHLAAVRAVAGLCDARTRGLALRSTEFEFEPGPLRGGDFRVDVGTAGSVALVLQALLPVMVACGRPVAVTLSGGTDVRGAPPVDFLQHVLLPLLARMGVEVGFEVLRRGYYPRGGGVLRAEVAGDRLRPLTLEHPGSLLGVAGVAHVANLPLDIAGRMVRAAGQRLARTGVTTNFDTTRLAGDEAVGSGGAVVLWATCEHTVLGAARVAERGVTAEAIGASVGDELAADIAAGVTLDAHASDQVLVYCALAGGRSCFTTRTVTPHVRTAMWLIEHLHAARFEVLPEAGRWRVTVDPRRGG